MNISSLEILRKVAQQGSFAAAARTLDLDPSSVSRTIASLEEQLSLRLFQRTTRRLLLTEAGDVYLKRVDPLLNELDYALDEARKVSEGPSGHLRMTASVSFGQACLLPHIKEFNQLYPDIKLELRLTDSVVDLVADGIDLACRLAPTSNSELIGIRLFDTHYRVCVSPGYLAHGTNINCPEDLEQHNCPVFTLPQYRTQWLFKDMDSNLTKVRIKSDLSISSALALRECALSGLGPVLLADWLVDDDIEEGRLLQLLTKYQVSAEDFDTAVWLLYPSRSFLPSKTRVMIDFLKSKFAIRKKKHNINLL